MRYLVLGLFAVLLASPAQAGQKVDYSVGGAAFEGYSAKASGKSKGMVLIVHDWDGLTDYEVKRAEMLAKLGYDAFALDLFGKGNRPKEIAAKRANTGKLYKDRATMRQRLLGGLSKARQIHQGKTVVMGYCFGGAAVLELARSNQAGDVSGYVTFHGGLKTPPGQSYPKNTPPLLIAHGGADKAVSMDQVAGLSKELEAQGITYDIEVYSGAPHAFTVIGSGRYRERADKQSWKAFTEFLASNL